MMLDAENPPIALPRRQPSLHELAAMPFPQSLMTMRKFVHPNWGKPVSDEEPRLFRVTVEYQVMREDSESYDVWAADEDAANEEARGLFDADRPHDAEIVHVACKELVN